MRILFISANRLGDAILSTGLIDALHAQFPKARFTVACGPAGSGLPATFSHICRPPSRSSTWK